MNENDVAFFSELLNEDAENVKKAVEDGTLSEKIKALGVMTKEQVETFKTNYAKEVKSSHINELTELAKKGELESDLYKVIKGASLEQLERKLAKEYGVEDYSNVDDLVAKAIKNSTAKPDDKKLNELTEKIQKLQDVNEKLVTEKEEAVNSARTEYESIILNREKADIVKSVPFDLTDVDEKELDKIATQRQKVLTDVFDARYSLSFDDGKVIVKDKEGKVLTSEATLEPVPMLNVFNKLASELGVKLKSPESGGQGGSSSGKKDGTKFKDEAEFRAYCEEHKILPTSKEGIALWTKGRPQR